MVVIEPPGMASVAPSISQVPAFRTPVASCGVPPLSRRVPAVATSVPVLSNRSPRSLGPAPPSLTYRPALCRTPPIGSPGLSYVAAWSARSYQMPLFWTAAPSRRARVPVPSQVTVPSLVRDAPPARNAPTRVRPASADGEVGPGADAQGRGQGAARPGHVAGQVDPPEPEDRPGRQGQVAGQGVAADRQRAPVHSHRPVEPGGRGGEGAGRHGEGGRARQTVDGDVGPRRDRHVGQEDQGVVRGAGHAGVAGLVAPVGGGGEVSAERVDSVEGSRDNPVLERGEAQRCGPPPARTRGHGADDPEGPGRTVHGRVPNDAS